MSHRTNTLRLARGNTARPFTGTALDVTLRACDRDVPEPVYLLAIDLLRRGVQSTMPCAPRRARRSGAVARRRRELGFCLALSVEISIPRTNEDRASR